MSSRQPQPRDDHAAVGVGQKLFVWGGDGRSPKNQTRTVKIFDVPSMAWQQPENLRGSQVPDKCWDMAIATDGESAYSFGGSTNKDTYFDTVFKVDLSTLLCEKLTTGESSSAPKKAQKGCMVYFNHKLIVHGGYSGEPTGQLHTFDLKTGEWHVCILGGEGVEERVVS